MQLVNISNNPVIVSKMFAEIIAGDGVPRVSLNRRFEYPEWIPAGKEFPQVDLKVGQLSAADESRYKAQNLTLRVRALITFTDTLGNETTQEFRRTITAIGPDETKRVIHVLGGRDAD